MLFRSSRTTTRTCTRLTRNLNVVPVSLLDTSLFVSLFGLAAGDVGMSFAAAVGCDWVGVGVGLPFCPALPVLFSCALSPPAKLAKSTMAATHPERWWRLIESVSLVPLGFIPSLAPIRDTPAQPSLPGISLRRGWDSQTIRPRIFQCQRACPKRFGDGADLVLLASATSIRSASVAFQTPNILS